MSAVFEGVLGPAQLAEVQKALISTTGPSLALYALADGLTAVSRECSRSEIQFSREIDGVAQILSRVFGAALVVRYDDRIGHRSSELYKKGELVESFGERDEVYVLLDEQGEPLRDGDRFKLEELDADEEYETIENAIQLGLAALGKGEWGSVYELLTGLRSRP